MGFEEDEARDNIEPAQTSLDDADTGLFGLYTGTDPADAPEMMEVGQLVDAALAGFDRRELVTIPPLQHAAHWDDLERTRQALLADINQANVAERYKV